MDRPLRRAMLTNVGGAGLILSSSDGALDPPKRGAEKALWVNIARGAADPPLPRSHAEPRLSFVLYRGFPSKLHHAVPAWVEPEALFHIRIRLDLESGQPLLNTPSLGQALLDSSRFYESKHRWFITIFLLMPDHIHALLSFPRDLAMGKVIGDWKHFQTVKNVVQWQEGFFDHRLRDDERGEQLSAKIDYIRQNPVAAGLCADAADWRWKIDPFA